MLFPSHLGPDFMRIIKPLFETDYPDHVKLQVMWNMLTTLQGVVLGHVLTGRIGNKVFSGPFREMVLVKDIMNRHFCPELLGTYGWEIHDAIESALAKPYKHVINVGCSFGYYSVGFARRMPDATIHAYDTDARARELCKKMIDANNVTDRVLVYEHFDGEEYEKFADDEALVILDVEGTEDELLDLEKYPALKKMDVIVKLHDFIKPNLSTLLPLRFATTHSVKVYPNVTFNFPLEKILGDNYPLSHFDNLIATWERLEGPTPYGIFTRK